MKSCTIVGGGVAGLCAAIRLTELGIKPTLIDAGKYPAHKVCGEFFSPECIPALQRWGIAATPIRSLNIYTNERKLSFVFPSPAGALSHYEFDTLLLNKAVENGANIRLETRVNKIDHLKDHRLHLSTGEQISTQQLIIASGRLFNHAPRIPEFIGIKAHFSNLPIKNSLELFTFKNGYVGIVPIENGKFNVACLVKLEEIEPTQSIDQFMDQLIASHPQLSAYLNQGTNLFGGWMSCSIPHLGEKKIGSVQHTYYIGDAAATLAPATGNGLSMAILSGIMSAEYAIQNDAIGFRKAWERKYRTPLFWGKILHQLMTKPVLGSMAIQLANWFPSFSKDLYFRTR